MRSWFELYKKELRSISFFMLVSILVILGWELFLMYKSQLWHFGLVFGLSFLPLSFLPIIMLWRGYQSYRQEWKDNTIYMLMSLPRSGWQIGLSKLLADLTYYLAAVLFTLFMVYVVNDTSLLPMLPPYITPKLVFKYISLTGIAYIIFGMIPYIFTQFSCLISRFYSRFRGLISIVVFVLTNYLVYRTASLIAPIFNWVPNIPIDVFRGSMIQVNMQTIYINSAPIVSIILMTGLVFYLGSILLEKQLEV